MANSPSSFFWTSRLTGLSSSPCADSVVFSFALLATEFRSGPFLPPRILVFVTDVRVNWTLLLVLLLVLALLLLSSSSDTVDE